MEATVDYIAIYCAAEVTGWLVANVPGLFARNGGGGGAGSNALVEMSENLSQSGTIRTIAGYEVWGNAGLVGKTYNINVLGLYATNNSQGLRVFTNALFMEAKAAGASTISITGNTIINQGIANISQGLAEKLGFTLTKINAETILLQGIIK